MKEIRLCDSGHLEEVSNLCLKNNFGIEVQSFHNPYLENMKDVVENHKQVLTKIKGGKSLHAPFWDLNIGTKMKLVREETMNMLNFAYSVAKKLNCTEIVVHNGYIPGTYLENAWIDRAVEFWKDFFEDKDDSITICIENQFELYSDMMKQEVDKLNDSRLKICLDIGHANANSNMTPEEWIEDLGERVAYLHLHNNHGKLNKKNYNNDEHLGLENGNINIENVLNKAEKYCPNAIWNIEANPKYLEESVEYLKEKFNV